MESQIFNFWASLLYNGSMLNIYLGEGWLAGRIQRISPGIWHLFYKLATLHMSLHQWGLLRLRPLLRPVLLTWWGPAGLHFWSSLGESKVAGGFSAGSPMASAPSSHPPSAGFPFLPPSALLPLLPQAQNSLSLGVLLLLRLTLLTHAPSDASQVSFSIVSCKPPKRQRGL